MTHPTAAPLGKSYRVSSDAVWPIQRPRPKPGSIVSRAGQWYKVEQDGSLSEWSK